MPPPKVCRKIFRKQLVIIFKSVEINKVCKYGVHSVEKKCELFALFLGSHCGSRGIFVDVFVHIVLGDEIAELGVFYKHGIFKSVIAVVFGGVFNILLGDLFG